MNAERKQRTLRVLRDMRELLAKPEAWRKQAYAGRRIGEPPTSPNGEWVVFANADPFSADANCWCLAGAIRKCSAFDVVASEWVRKELQATLGVVSIPKHNDAPERTHAEIVGAIDTTITRLEAA